MLIVRRRFVIVFNGFLFFFSHSDIVFVAFLRKVLLKR